MNPNNADSPPSRQGTFHELDQTLRIAIGAVGRWKRRTEKAMGQYVPSEELTRKASLLEARARALVASGSLPTGTHRLDLTLWLEDGPLQETVDLDPATAPRIQAERWFSQARKWRRAILHQTTRRTSLEEELLLASQWQDRFALWQSPETDAKTARQALRELENLRRKLLCRGLWPQPPGKRDEPRPLGPIRWDLENGWYALAGKSGTENDFLTTRLAQPHDLWFHVANVSGAHVILRSPDGKPRTPPPTCLEQAAGLAAWLSRYRAQEKVEVRFTERKHVRKPRKAPAGTVQMDQSRSILVRPQAPPRLGL
ncbi:MAG TPA: NFACT RNA binding domain-containing protein [Fibrobacteria bacterium]|nr:NFACT RNA binding domain-containing protein [Fibrobacteria bacterium]HOX50191.1 NFACT RNA binding domain-containing protein [Fibrobacteria bacterium]